jgi:molybdopterin-guanine dinucleotide biosynthesis protein A
VLDKFLEARGPLSGIAATLQICRSDHLLVLAIDLAQMRADFLLAMTEEVKPSQGIVPAIDGRFEPLAAIYPRDAAEMFNESAESLQVLLRNMIEGGFMLERAVQPDERHLFHNVNEPADLIAS